MVPPVDSKSYQLRVRVTPEERDQLESACALARNRGETISDLVREALSLLIKGASEAVNSALAAPRPVHQVNRLADLLKREPRQVEQACVEGIIDLIESKCEVPLIVMETRLHLKYHQRDEKQDFPWKLPQDQPVASD